MLGLAEERGLGGEESEVLAFVVQAAVPAAHAVTAGHGGSQHCADGHGEVFQDTGAAGSLKRASGRLGTWRLKGLSAAVKIPKASDCPSLTQKRSEPLRWRIQFKWCWRWAGSS